MRPNTQPSGHHVQFWFVAMILHQRRIDFDRVSEIGDERAIGIEVLAFDDFPGNPHLRFLGGHGLGAEAAWIDGQGGLDAMRHRRFPLPDETPGTAPGRKRNLPRFIVYIPVLRRFIFSK